MTKTKSTKRALLMSGLALLMCVSMLIGSTFAWFTDSVTSKGNIIKSGTLDVEMYWAKGTEAPESANWIDASTGAIFDYDLWEPGYTEVRHIKIENKGSLALKYQLSIAANGEVSELADVIDVYYLDPAQQLGERSAISADNKLGTLTEVLAAISTTASGALEPEQSHTITLALKMQEEAGNTYQGKEIGADFSVILAATQKDFESDSFGKDYDEDAAYPPKTYTDVDVASLAATLEKANNGDTIQLVAGMNTTDTPLTETIVIDKEIILNPNGMYLVSNAPATFTVAEGGKLTITEGSYTVKNTASEGAAVIVDGGEFEMAGGSFDAHTAVRTTEGKSSTVTLSAGWSNRVTVGFDLKGNDTLNVTGGSIYTSKEAVKTVAGTHADINISGGTLSSGATQYSAAVQLNGSATVDMTGGTLASTYSSGLNGSAAIEANAAPTTINISGTAKLEAKGWGVTLGSHWSSPAVMDERFVLNVSGDAVINVTGDTGFGIRYCQDACDVTVSGNAKVSAKYHAIQMNSNSYVFSNSTLTIAENAAISSTAGRYGGGYGVAANGNVTITGGTITGSTVGLTSTTEGSVITIDNSASGTPITINSVNIADTVVYTVTGNPTIG